MKERELRAELPSFLFAEYFGGNLVEPDAFYRVGEPLAFVPVCLVDVDDLRYRSGILLGESLAVSAVLLLFWHWLALCLLLLTLLIFGGCARMEQKQFGGITGDLAGFFLVLGETGWLLGAALLGGGFSCV